MVVAARPSRTLSGDVHRALRDDILAGRLAPGQKLRLNPICARFGVSLSVVREALTRLAEQGLVRSEPQVGFSVVTLDPDDLVDLTRVRIAIEVLALRGAMERGDLAWKAEIVSSLYSLENTPVLEGDALNHLNDDWARHHKAFHTALVAGCGSRYLLSIRSSLYDTSEIYRRWAVGPTESTRDIRGEHRAIQQAVLAGDVDLACALLAKHIQTTTDILLRQGAGGPAAPAG